MLNQVPVSTEANFSGSFLKNYLEFLEEFPDSLSNNVTSSIRELDVKTFSIVKELEQITKQIKVIASSQKSKLYGKLQQLLITLQDLNDEKIIYSNQMTEMIEIKYRQVDLDYTNLGSFSTARRDEILVEVSNLIKQDRVQSPVPSLAVAKSSKSFADQVFSNFPMKTSSNPDSNLSTSTNNSATDMNVSAINNQDRGSKRARRNRETIDDKVECLDLPIKMEVVAVKPVASTQSVASSSNQIIKKVAANALTGKKKKRKAGRQTTNQTNQTISRDQTVAPVLPPEETIDPDEPTYCLCDQISYGEMIMCDNDSCSIEWFHFSCVSLLTKPKGRWFCPNCRGDRQNVMNKNLRKRFVDSLDYGN